MVIRSDHLPHDEADRIENAVRRGIPAHIAPKIGSVAIAPARIDNRIIEVGISIPSRGDYRLLKFLRNEQSSTEIEQRVREKLADL